MQPILTVNGEILPFAPTKMVIKKSDLYSDSTKRNAETGTLLMYPIRQNICTIELEFLLDTAQTKLLENLISGTSLAVSFMDGDEKIHRNMYPSDRTKELTGTKKSRKYVVSFSLIEI